MRPAAMRWLPARSDRAAGANRRKDTMQACVIASARQAALQDVPRPEPGPGQVLLRLEGSGVCAPSRPLLEGRDRFG